MTEFSFSTRSAADALATLNGAGEASRQRGEDEEHTRDRYARMVWSHLSEPGDGVAGRAIAAVGAAPALESVIAGGGPPGSVTLREWADAMKRWRPRLDQSSIDDSVRLAARGAVRLLTPGEEDWPTRLDDLGDHAPVCLWVKGDPSSLGSGAPPVAIVGARAATSYGEHVALEISADLAGSGGPIVSGGAYGIDGAAHRAALTIGGITIALLAGGADRPYPAGHANLLEMIAERGAVASEVPPGSAPTKWRFLQRNRLIAALADATVVVEAGWRSGSLNTAGHAAALARPLGAVPGPVTSSASAGCHRLLREFDAVCVTSADDVREMLGAVEGRRGGLDNAGGPAGATRTDDATRVLDALSARTWRDSGDTARRAGMTGEEVEALLGLLALEGRVEEHAGGWRRRATDGGTER